MEMAGKRALRRRQDAAHQPHRGGDREPLALREAFDRLNHGLLLLDSRLRAHFINRACRGMWALPDALADADPSLVDLLQHGYNSAAYAVPPEELEAYVAGRLEHLRAGNGEPRELRLRDGHVLRCESAALPDGGRLVSYVDITEQVQAADELRRLAITDELTGLFNRRHFLHVIERELGRFERYGRPLSLVMLDIDHFKRVNDQFGHAAGDVVLKSIAQSCRKALRGTDAIARIGGEEFAVVTCETPLAEAAAVAERIRQDIAAVPIPYDAQHLTITVSLGVAEAGPQRQTINDILEAADRALYEGKTRGRNCVVAAPSTIRSAMSASRIEPLIAEHVVGADENGACGAGL
jgi:diguanylate cyclase (GGDEF)-like protein